MVGVMNDRLPGIENSVYKEYDMPMNSREIIERLTEEGWQLKRVRGSHHVYSHPDRSNPVVVPHPSKEIPTGTLRSIFRQAGWDWSTRE